MFASPAYAQAAGGAAPGRAAGFFVSVFPLVLIFVIFYFLLIRPQQRRARQQRQLLSDIDVGDEVVTIGGIHGTVRSIDEDDMELEIAPGTVVTFVKSAVARKVWDEEEDAALAEATEEEEA